MSVYKQLHQMYKEVRNLWQKEYPSFIFDIKPQEIDFIPIFVYHRVDPVEFEADLSFLEHNGYRTVTGDDYTSWLSGDKHSWRRCVLLTFDDGMSSVFFSGLPLLRKYSMHAMVFLISGYIPEPIKESVASCRDTLWNPLLTWNEIRQMHDSGCFSFGSHTSYHHPTFSSNKVFDFGNPRLQSMLFDIPIEKGKEPNVLKGGEAHFWGTPIYDHTHFMQATCLYSNESATNACLDYVRSNGTVWFFDRCGWRRELKQVVRRYQSKGKMLGRKEITALVSEDLRNSKASIEQHLGVEISQLCYPCGAGSGLSVTLSKEAGYKTNFWQTLPTRNRNYPGSDPYRLVRLKKDFLRRLPGKGRRSLADIYFQKVKRRIEGNPYY